MNEIMAVPIRLQPNRLTDRAVTPAIRMRFERDLNANRLTGRAIMPAIN